MKPDVTAQIENLRADVALLAETVAEQTKSKVTQQTEAVKTVAAEAADTAKARYAEATELAETRIKEKPLTAIAIAVAAGLVLGAVTRR